MAETYSDMLGILLAGGDLRQDQSRAAFGQIMDGQWTEAQVAGLLVALAAKGETPEEIAGAAIAMREHAVKIDAGCADVVDTCGTGGTGLRTFNISTAAAIVAAGAGATVAKHGNRTNTRASGSADVLVALGVNIDADADCVARCLREAGVGFCFAVRCHPAMKYAAGVRKALGVRTIFNVLGPLTNPAGAKRQLMGVSDANLAMPIAAVLGKLGAVHAMVVHAEDGLDEISTTSPTTVCELREGKVTTRTVRPEEFGLARADMSDLLINSPETSAKVIRDVLAGAPGPARDIVVLNAAAALCVAGKADGIPAGIEPASRSIETGAAAAALDKLIAISNAG